MVLAIFLPSALPAIPHPEYYVRFREGRIFVDCAVLALAVGAVVIRRSGDTVARWVEQRLANLSANFGHRQLKKIREFGKGLDTIHGPLSLLILSVVSVGMWYIIALAYQEVTHSYGVPALEIPVSQLLILMGASMLDPCFSFPRWAEVHRWRQSLRSRPYSMFLRRWPASCGILLWLVTFAAVIPLGSHLGASRAAILAKTVLREHHAEEGAAALPSA